VIKDWFKATTYMGLGMIGVGFLFIFLAWNGAAEVDTPQQQIPYVISGGLTGLGLIVLGAAVLLLQDARKAWATQQERLEELRHTLERLVGGLGAAAYGSGSNGEIVVAGTSSFHDPSCHLAQGREEAERIPRPEAEERGLKACRICKP
jgi:hypothetical protein